MLVGPDDGDGVPAGTLALAPPLVVHGFRNASDGEMRYLNFHAPGGGFARVPARREQPGFDSFGPARGRRPACSDAYIGGGEVLSDRPGLRVSLLVDVDEIGIAEVTSRRGASRRRRTCTAATPSRSTSSPASSRSR